MHLFLRCAILKRMITVTILTKNSAATLKKTLASVVGFSEVLIFDTGSTDETLQIAREFPNVQVHQGSFSGFGPTHNLASSLAKHDWILSLDSDEILSEELSSEILKRTLYPNCVYEIRRHNFFNGKRIRGCSGWDPDFVVRLYNRKRAKFNDAKVHETVLYPNLNKVPLKHPILHTPYLQIEDFLTKMQNYSTLFVHDQKHKKSASLLSALCHGWWAFIKSYVVKRGFLSGKEGLIISLYNSHTTFYKYLKLAQEKGPKRTAPKGQMTKMDENGPPMDKNGRGQERGKNFFCIFFAASFFVRWVSF